MKQEGKIWVTELDSEPLYDLIAPSVTHFMTYIVLSPPMITAEKFYMNLLVVKINWENKIACSSQGALWAKQQGDDSVHTVAQVQAAASPQHPRISTQQACGSYETPHPPTASFHAFMKPFINIMIG